MISNRNKLYGGLLGLLMLAGCGSGSDTSDSATTKATPEQSAPLSQASPGTGSGTLTTKAPAALGSQDISAELLSSLLMQGTTGNGKVDEFRAFPAYPWNGPGPRGSMRRDVAGRIPLLHGGQDLLPIQGIQPDYRFRIGSWHGPDPRVPAFSFGSLDTELRVTMPSGTSWPTSLGPQHSNYVINPPAGELLFTLGATATTRLRNGVYDPAAQPAEQRELRADSTYTGRSGQRIPLHKALQTWRDDQGNFVELLLLPGARRDEIRLCLNQHVPTVKRLHCTIWRVPADWSYGYLLDYKGLYVVDDRSTRPGERGHLFWQSSDQAQRFASPPVSSRAVRGDFLAAVLTTPVTTYDDTGTLYPIWSAYPWNGPNPRGSAIADPKVPVVDGWSGNNLPSEQHPLSSHSFTSFVEMGNTGAYEPMDFDEATLTFSFRPTAGKTYPDSWQPDTAENGAEGTFVSGKHLFSTHDLPSIGTELLRLEGNADARVYRGPDGGQSRPATRISLAPAAGNLVLRHGVNVPMHRVLQRWQNGEHSAELILLDSYRRDQFRLCLNHHLPRVKRLLCSIWQVPANWQLDQVQPRFKGIYVSDDRSAVGGEGNLYWQTDPNRARRSKSLQTRNLRHSSVEQKSLQSGNHR